ncbi:MAG TPA: sensor histidine kinase [Chthoniobacterales bacterium]|nr:sensor histidine kinase [Chthoniobacterales bacterium]
MRTLAYIAPNAFGSSSNMTGLRWRNWLTTSPTALAAVCLLITAGLGYLDYLTGYEQTFLLFYLVPIGIGTWFGNFWSGLTFSVLSIVAWVVSDVVAGVPTVGLWNIGMAFGSYAVFTSLLSKLRTLLNELDQRVRDRTAALKREMAERERLDQEIAEVADRERRRLGQNLHDSLGQHLTGTALAAQVLREKLADRSASEVAEADKVVHYIEEGIDLTRNLARGFFSPELEADGLDVALYGLAANITERFRVPCTFNGDDAVDVGDSTTATQLYHIAQEAVMNAVKHAGASKIDIELARNGQKLTLAVSDDGRGFPEKLPEPPGLGLRLMTHGASLIGGKLAIGRNRDGGTVVTCKLNAPQPAD